ncbi:thioesterase family protein [Rhodobium gokarnense]|uniref:Acyl-CoA thioester hydrolase n=1 Tax=Rhodobium gokarnense TaxID=364296 RepID=A0ABT3H9E5_9HYPH|nr:thioesterase family protein [Rhodobium gokarnense]MCW2307008.1 acyl-CoA thioester hydrolase [Rhodobium gokarnense]
MSGTPALSSGADTAPFRSSRKTVLPEWIDYNGHLNMAYYNVLFDTAIDEFFLAAGLGPDYVASENASFFTVEAHICYVRELAEGAPVHVESRILDVDDKRLHSWQELYHAEEGFLSATSEQMFLHVDMESRRTAPWPAPIRERLDALQGAATKLGRPERAGRAIRIARKASEQSA